MAGHRPIRFPGACVALSPLLLLLLQVLRPTSALPLADANLSGSGSADGSSGSRRQLGFLGGNDEPPTMGELRVTAEEWAKGRYSDVKQTVAEAGEFASDGILSVLNVSADRLRRIVSVVANLAYVAIMLYGFAKLPANFMLIAGLLTMAVGPSALRGCFALASALVYVAYDMPILVVFVAWCAVFFSSALFQRIGLALGLDRDGDGDVDWLDGLKMLSETALGRCLFLREVHRSACKHRFGRSHTIDSVGERLELIELRLEKLLGPDRGKVRCGALVKSQALTAPSKSPNKPSPRHSPGWVPNVFKAASHTGSHDMI